MACSKLFSGDLPEISTYIIQNLRNNFNTLYSLALVNRFWCRLAIPLLWEDPFSIKCRKNIVPHFLDIYFLFLNDTDKSKWKEIKFLDDSKLKKPLFHYPSLIKTLNSYRMELHVANWISASYNITPISAQLFPLTSAEPYELRYETSDVDEEKTNVVRIALFKLFIENNASLNNLNMNIGNNTYQFTYDICDIVLNNPKFISEIFHFEFFDYFYSLSYNKSFETFLSSFTSPIKHIGFCSKNLEVRKNFTNIIQRTQLSSITFWHIYLIL